MLTVLTDWSLQGELVRHDHGGAACAASDRPLVAFSQVIEQHDQLVKCQTCVWNEILKELECRTQALAPCQIWKARLRIRHPLGGKHFQHLAYARDRICFSSQAWGRQKCSKLTRGRARRSPRHLLRLLPPVQLRELSYTVRRQPGPSADRARARLVREHAHGKIEAAQVAGIAGVGDTHDGIRGAMAFTPISDVVSGVSCAVWEAARPRRSGKYRRLCELCARLSCAFAHSRVAFHPPAQAGDYRGDGAIGRTLGWRLLERERLRRTPRTSQALSVAGGRCVPTCSTSRPAPVGFGHGMGVPTHETSAPGRAASIVPRFF